MVSSGGTNRGLPSSSSHRRAVLLIQVGSRAISVEFDEEIRGDHWTGGESGRMPIFISYSHQDRKFVDRLALQLVQNKVNVWLDRWELSVGDSLLSKVQDAITGASALLVVLSQASVGSAWVQKEINSGLLRELEERRVIVLPVRIEDCQIPVFLREKVYADFRSDFDAGLRRVLESVASISNAATGRIDEPQYHSDWALDWDMTGDRTMLRFTIVEQAQGQPYTVLSLVEILA